MLKVIGLTGSIATGKSFVSDIVKKNGYPVIDADKIAAFTVQRGQKAYYEIVENFGKEILNEAGELNRKKLRNIIFSNEEKKKLLNEITHKYIRKEYIRKLNNYEKEGKKIVFYDVPLLFEVGLDKEFYKIIVVYAPLDIQIKRLMKRDGISYQEALKAIKSQMDIEIKKKKADFLIDNSGSKEQTYSQVIEVIKKLKEL